MKINLQTAKQNQKISFPFLFPLRGGGVGGGDARKMQGNFFGFCTRESASVSEAHCIASPRNRGVRRGLDPPRAPRMRLVIKILQILSEIHSNFVQYTPQITQIFKPSLSNKLRFFSLPPAPEYAPIVPSDLMTR